MKDFRPFAKAIAGFVLDLLDAIARLIRFSREAPPQWPDVPSILVTTITTVTYDDASGQGHVPSEGVLTRLRIKSVASDAQQTIHDLLAKEKQLEYLDFLWALTEPDAADDNKPVHLPALRRLRMDRAAWNRADLGLREAQLWRENMKKDEVAR
ncbi:hypothetical protein HGRIS_012228 [Hohenbuehelia grisea]|uniref:Uncharacterized protein n=1 Tax=Hohenbuehelia grisea TaxID=104357 RepID=A0ABR3IRL5_9AGAR